MKRLTHFLAFIACLLLAASPALAGVPAIPPPAPVVKNLTAATAGAIMWGDSLTYGKNDNAKGDVPFYLGQLLTMNVPNKGIGGQTSTQIVQRMGARPITLTVSGNALSGSVSVVTAVNGVSIVGMSTGQDPDYRFLATPSANITGTDFGTLCGRHGVLQMYGQSGGPPSTSLSSRFLTDVAPFPALSCPAGSVYVTDNAALLPLPTILWAGRNNYAHPSTVEADIAYAAAAVDPNKYLILGVINGNYTTEVSGQAGYNQIVAINTNSASLYGSHFWDVRSWLVSQYNAGNPVDVQDHANDVVPYSLRAIVAGGTLSAIGDTSTCSFTLTPSYGSATVGVWHVDSEYINVTANTGNTVTACNRGWGTGAPATTHSNGAAVTITDNIHLASTTDSAIASQIATTYTTPLFGTVTTGVNTGASSAASAAQPWFTLKSSRFYQAFGSGLIMDNAPPTFCDYNILNASSDVACMATMDSGGNLFLGGAYVNSLRIGTGGSGGTAGQVSQNNGDFTFTRHITTTQTAPALTSCGTSPTIVGGDLAGTITEGSVATGCVMTFAGNFSTNSSAVHCVLSSQGGLGFTYTESATAVTIINVGALSSTAIDYVCIGK